MEFCGTESDKTIKPKVDFNLVSNTLIKYRNARLSSFCDVKYFNFFLVDYLPVITKVPYFNLHKYFVLL
jgi:hypothetical protein